ncbi:DNA adenine methylase [Burkholderia seminalis]|uniref:DNA adenine methylase n=1 Tax=Burkholderia seminalis TaxID=488731 RepID=UPI00345215CF
MRLVLQVGDQLQLVLDLRLNVDRDAGRETLTDIQRAARFFYLRHHAFGGLVAGQTFGTAPAINLLRIEENLSAAHLRLAAGTTIENLPWSECLRRYDCAHTFFYADPPYWQTEGYGVPFEWAEYERLAEAMRLSKGKMMLSINDHPDIRACFAGLPKYELSMRYSVANKEGKSKESGELVILNYEPSLMGDLLSGGHDPQE